MRSMDKGVSIEENLKGELDNLDKKNSGNKPYMVNMA